jgi:tetratricopeptide (TPR) repeat protein
MANPYSIPPAALEGLLELYARSPDDLDAPSLLILARAFERMGCDEQALDCADRAAKLDPESRRDAVEVARRCVGRVSGPT